VQRRGAIVDDMVDLETSTDTRAVYVHLPI
jgi:hypothetical protein